MDILVLMFYINVAGVLYFFLSPSTENVASLETSIVMMEEKTQHIDPIVKRYARLYGLDWRFIYAMIHVESRFQEDALSQSGAVGLMQVLPTVGKELNIHNLYHPGENIKAGVRHFYRYLLKLKGHTLQDRIQMALAAYNGGIGHVYDAKRLATHRGLDPYAWSSLEQVLPELEHAEVHQNYRHGYCQGNTMVRYVQEIQKMYQRYKTSFPATPTIETSTQPTSISLVNATDLKALDS